MKNYTLILLKDGRNILVSDEKAKINEYAWYSNTITKKLMDVDWTTNDFKIIAGIKPLPTLSYSDEVKQILRDKYGWVDVNEEAKKDYFKYHFKYIPPLYSLGFHKGFELHQSITNKKFSLEDMKNFAVFAFKNFAGSNVNDAFDKWQSLQQPIQLKVEIKEEQNSILITKILN